MLDENLDAVIKFQLTRPARGATSLTVILKTMARISTHTPREGRDRIKLNTYKSSSLFQLTRPARGATILPCHSVVLLTNFNSHAPRGARLRLYFS